MSGASFSSGAEANNVRQRHVAPGSFPEEADDYLPGNGNGASQQAHANPPEQAPHQSASYTQGTKHYKPRTCRICLEVVQPTTHPSTIPSIPGLAPQPPRVVYSSEDPELGRLISPCRCRGSSRYVHEGCLAQWRMHSPSSERNYWKCPTCGYQYRLERLFWARFIQSAPSQALLTLLVFLVATFVVGFVADPIINLYLDPWSLLGWGWSDYGPLDTFEPSYVVDDEDEPGTWVEHFLKGVTGLGVLGFAKAFLMSPLQYFRLRFPGSTAGAARNTGRDRMANISWAVILIGVFTTLYGIYQGVRAFSRRALMATAERVMDVGRDDNDDND